MTTNFPVTYSERLQPFSLTVEVTQDFIDEGVKGDMCDCPIALALKEKLPKGLKGSTRVTLENVGVGHPGYVGCSAEVSPAMESFILDFDTGKEVKPCSFYLYFRPVYEG